jgi:exopolysaccharide biosynthesis WecB/TagA/CpsF family protein
MRSKSFLGVRFDDLSAGEVISQIFDFVHQDKLTRRGQILVTPNMDFLTRMHAKEVDQQFVQIIQNADECLCDSRVMRLLAFLKGRTIGHVVTGSDLTRELMHMLEARKRPVAVVGPSADDMEALITRFDINVVDHECPPFGFMSDDNYVESLCKRLVQSESDIIFLSIGSPRQELLASKIIDHGSKAVILCIGASIDFLTGKEIRAPVFLQRIHMEWLFRLCTNPRRLVTRYSSNFVFLLKVLMG